MPRLSDRQAHVIYSNARFLDLPIAEERWLLEKAHLTDMESGDCNDLVGSIFEYMRFRRPVPDENNERLIDTFRTIIKRIIHQYGGDIYEPELSKKNENHHTPPSVK